jgi:hypothetical protein
MYQDQDGIERRITLWFNPNARVALKDVLNESPLQHKTPGASPSPATPTRPAAPAEPVDTGNEAAPGSNPFASPLDQGFHVGKLSTDLSASNAPSTNAPPKVPAPAGLKSP